MTRITLWNQWGHETINPVFRVWTTMEPVFDASSEQWKMSAERIALGPSIEFLLRTSDNEARYRISRKPILEENEY